MFADSHRIPELPDKTHDFKLDGHYVPSLSSLGTPASGEGVSVQGDTLNCVVMFIDMGAFTERTHELRPVQTLYWVNQFFHGLTPLFRKHCATLDKVIGDCVMMVLARKLGCPEPVQAATKIALHALRWDVRAFRPSIGIAKGECFLGWAGPSDELRLTVVGNTVNLASRLCSHGPGLHIAMPTELWAVASKHIEIDDRRFEVRSEQAQIKGLAEVSCTTIQCTTRWIMQGHLPDLKVELDESDETT